MVDRVEIGDAVLYHGDCLEILPTLPKVDAVVTDPPYGVKFCTQWANKFQRVEIANDDSVFARDAVLRWHDGTALVFGSWKAPKPAGTRMVLIWDKGTVGMGALDLPWFPCTEEIYVLGDGFVGSRTSAVMRHVVRNESHPTEKPVPLLQQLLAKCQGQVVADPFMGSGTTGVACANLGRKFIGIEIERKYFDIACERIAAAYAQGRLPFEYEAAARQSGLSLCSDEVVTCGRGNRLNE